MAKFKLTETQKQEIEIAEQTIKQIQLLKRIQSIKMRDKGMTNIMIGDILGKSDQTISNWIERYRKGGLKSLLEWNYKGRISVLTTENIEKIIQRHKQKPFEKAAELKAYIKLEFGIDYHLHWVQKILKKNFNLHTKKQN